MFYFKWKLSTRQIVICKLNICISFQCNTKQIATNRLECCIRSIYRQKTFVDVDAIKLQYISFIWKKFFSLRSIASNILFSFPVSHNFLCVLQMVLFLCYQMKSTENGIVRTKWKSEIKNKIDGYSTWNLTLYIDKGHDCVDFNWLYTASIVA